MFPRQAKHVRKAQHLQNRLWLKLQVGFASLAVTVLAVTGLSAAPVAAPASPASTPIVNEIPLALKAPATVPKKVEIKKVGATGPISRAPAASTAGITWKQARIYRSALAQVGWRQDCVAMVARSLRSVGINYYVWPWQYYNIGYPVSYWNARPGDLVYWRNGGAGWAHIAVYIGGGKAVHGGWNARYIGGGTTVVATVWLGSGPQFIRVR